MKCDCICNLPYIIQIDTANESITLYGVLETELRRTVLPSGDLLVELISCLPCLVAAPPAAAAAPAPAVRIPKRNWY